MIIISVFFVTIAATLGGTTSKSENTKDEHIKSVRIGQTTDYIKPKKSTINFLSFIYDNFSEFNMNKINYS